MAFEFYHGHGSPYSWRVWLALEHKKIPYELHVLSFANKDTQKPEFVAINPRHVVPTIVDDGFALWESVVILEYLEERFPDAPRLYPGDARARAGIRRLIREAEEHIDRKGIDLITDELFWKEGGAPDMARVEEWKGKVAGELALLAGEMRGDHLCAGGLTAADFVLYPMVAYAQRITFRKPETRLTDAIPAKLLAWAKRIEALPYFDKTFPPHWR